MIDYYQQIKNLKEGINESIMDLLNESKMSQIEFKDIELDFQIISRHFDFLDCKLIKIEKVDDQFKLIGWSRDYNTELSCFNTDYPICNDFITLNEIYCSLYKILHPNESSLEFVERINNE